MAPRANSVARSSNVARPLYTLPVFYNNGVQGREEDMRSMIERLLLATVSLTLGCSVTGSEPLSEGSTENNVAQGGACNVDCECTLGNHCSGGICQGIVRFGG